jgi:hypothetical protein
VNRVDGSREEDEIWKQDPEIHCSESEQGRRGGATDLRHSTCSTSPLLTSTIVTVHHPSQYICRITH